MRDDSLSSVLRFLFVLLGHKIGSSKYGGQQFGSFPRRYKCLVSDRQAGKTCSLPWFGQRLIFLSCVSRYYMKGEISRWGSKAPPCPQEGNIWGIFAQLQKLATWWGGIAKYSWSLGSPWQGAVFSLVFLYKPGPNLEKCFCQNRQQSLVGV